MRSSNAKYAFLALAACAFLYTGCQKAASRSIKAKVGGQGQQTTTQTTQEDQKLEELLKEDKTSDVCPATLLQKNKELQAEIAATKQIVVDNTDKKLAPEVHEDLLARSSKIKTMLKALGSEIVKNKAASCGKKSDTIQFKTSRELANETFLAIAKVTGQETPESKAAQEANKNQQNSETGSELVMQEFKASKDLIEVLDKDHQKSFTFVVDGKIANMKANYQKILDSKDISVCLIEAAPSEKLADEAILKVIGTSATSSLSSDSNKVNKSTIQLKVQLTSGSSALSFSCRLTKSLKEQSTLTQFAKIFGSLLSR